MKGPDLNKVVKDTYTLLSSIDYDRLPISDYNKQYIARIKPALQYYLTIYAHCIVKGMRHTDTPLSGLTLVDFGGGSGFLSIYAKKMGVGNVIYVDLNPLSVDTVKILKAKTGIGPDTILHGSTDVLAAWCSKMHIKPDLLIATDLIEHVYDLELFFNELIGINNRMRMVFTTASTPFNPYVKRRLHRMMRESEYGKLESLDYYTKRKNFISQRFVSLSEHDADEWALRTRGLTYPDIERAINENNIQLPLGAYNTCDPETGNWTERILPIKTYRHMLRKHNYKVSLYKGFYNRYRSGKLKSLVFMILNQLIRITGGIGLIISPFIMLVCNRKK